MEWYPSAPLLQHCQGCWPLLFQGFLYKAVGTALAASQNISYVQEQMQSYLEGISSLEASEREVGVLFLVLLSPMSPRGA